jgi:tetratricopeptide (TPR) repeat protein
LAADKSFGELVDFRKLWDFSDPAATESKFRELLPQAESATHPSYLDELLTQIARAEGLQRKFDEAHRTLDRVEDQLDVRPPIVRIRYLLERGRVFNSSGKPETAEPLFVDAWELAQAADEGGLAVDAAHMVAIVVQGDESLKWNEIALEFAERSSAKAAQQWLGSLYNNIGWTYHDKGEFENALDHFQRALVWRQQREDTVATRIAMWSVARAMRSLNQVEEALATQQELLAEWESAGGADGFVFEELAECLFALDRVDEARNYFQLAHAELAKDTWLAENEAPRLARLKEFGGTGSP